MFMYLFWVLFFASTAELQAQFRTMRMLSPRIQVATTPTTVSPGQVTVGKIALQSANGQAQLTPTDLTLTITLTALDTLEAAKRKLSDARTQALKLPTPIEKQTLVLPTDKDTIQATCVMRANTAELQLRIVSFRAGRFRVFAEAPNFLSGAALFSVVPKKLSWHSPVSPIFSEGPAAYHFIKAHWQQPSATPTLALNPTAYQIKFAAINNILLPEGALLYTFNLLFNRGEEPALAPQDIEARLRVIRPGNERVAFKSSSIIIPKGKSQSLEFELQAFSSGTFKLVADAPSGPNFTVQKDEMDLPVIPPMKATALMLNWDRSTALASGFDPITITVVPVVGEDKAVQPVSPAEEGLEKREIQFHLNPGMGFQFKDGKNTVEIPKDGSSAQLQVFGKNPLQKLDIKASSLTRNGKVDGETKVKFVFPWWYLVLAFGGGALARVRHFKELGFLAWGALIGLILFAVFSLGALVIGQITLSPSWTLELGKLPVENPLTSVIVGFFASLLIKDDTWQFLKSKIPSNKEASEEQEKTNANQGGDSTQDG
jgi:hypothetical protein